MSATPNMTLRRSQRERKPNNKFSPTNFLKKLKEKVSPSSKSASQFDTSISDSALLRAEPEDIHSQTDPVFSSSVSDNTLLQAENLLSENSNEFSSSVSDNTLLNHVAQTPVNSGTIGIEPRSLSSMLAEESPASSIQTLVTESMVPYVSPNISQTDKIIELEQKLLVEIEANKKMKEENRKLNQELTSERIRSNNITNSKQANKKALQKLDEANKLLIQKDEEIKTLNNKMVESETNQNSALLVDANGYTGIYYFRSRWDVLSNFYQSNINYEGFVWKNAEQLYQYKKAVFHNRLDLANDIKQCTYAHDAKAKIRELKKCKTAWHDSKAGVMKEIMNLKWDQCEEFRRVLMSTKGKNLVHNMEDDPIWGFGRDGKGENLQGKILEEVRAEHMEDEEFVLVSRKKQKSPPEPSVRPVNKNPVNPSTDSTEYRESYSDVVKKTSGVSYRKQVPQEKSSLIVIGNSNARGLSDRFRKNGIETKSVVYTGAPTAYIGSQLKSGSKEKSDFVLLHTGDIDVRDRKPMDQVLKETDQFLAEATNVFRDRKILVNTLPEVRDQGLNERIVCLNQFILDRCRQNSHLGLIPVNSTKLPLKRDMLHLSNRGSEFLVKNVKSIMQSI